MRYYGYPAVVRRTRHTLVMSPKADPGSGLKARPHLLGPAHAWGRAGRRLSPITVPEGEGPKRLSPITDFEEIDASSHQSSPRREGVVGMGAGANMEPSMG